jgi:hypothetical protein
MLSCWITPQQCYESGLWSQGKKKEKKEEEEEKEKEKKEKKKKKKKKKKWYEHFTEYKHRRCLNY